MTHASLFSGIGGFDLAASWMGWQNAFHCEWNPFCQHVLKHHFPDAVTYTDINTTDFTIWRGRIDILTGGFPCQPFSTAGQRKGTADDRYLWPQMLRCIREVQPRWVVGENVDGIFTWNDGLVFETVCADLENEGYEVQAIRIPACATEAPHRRDRWWFIAHARSQGTGRESGTPTDQGRPTSTDRPTCLRQTQWPTSASGAQPTIADAPNPDRQRQPQPGGPLREIGRRAGNCIEQRLDKHPTGEGLENRQQTGRQSPHSENGAGMEHRITDTGGHAAHHGHQGLQRDELGRTPQQRPGPPRPIAQRFENEHWLEAATRLCILDDGLPGRLDPATLSFGKPIVTKLSTRKQWNYFNRWRKESLKAAGNAVVPQIPYAIFQAIAHAETGH